jgi:hypothetical protein
MTDAELRAAVVEFLNGLLFTIPAGIWPLVVAGPIEPSAAIEALRDIGRAERDAGRPARGLPADVLADHLAAMSPKC